MKEILIPSDEYQIRFYCNTKTSKTCWFDCNPKEDGTYIEMTLYEAFRYASEDRSVKCPHCGTRMQPDSHIRHKEKTQAEILESELWQLTDDEVVESWLDDYREATRAHMDSLSDDEFEEQVLPHELVFVYGTLKRGFGNHSYLNGSEFLGIGVLRDSRMELVSLGFCPAVVKVHEEKGNGVAGELYSVNHKTLRRLDALEGNGFLYAREQFEVDYYCHKTETTKAAVAWVYVLLENNLEPLTSDDRAKHVSAADNSFLPRFSSCVGFDDAGIQHWIKQEELKEPFELTE